DRRLAEHRISDARAVPVLHIARAGDAMRQRELADLMGIEGPSLVRLLDQLCAAGLVERRPDRADGRAKTLHITASGGELAGVVETVLHGLRDQLFVDVSDDDIDATLRTMAALDRALRTATGAAPQPAEAN
ncbi:MAG: winged helix DNA-binding protein, partial [Sphingomonadales bacterium]|nr:winged helix DNA-binding protein [Sphingomonadales bacterium]